MTYLNASRVELPGDQMEETATRPLVLVIDDDEGIREGIVDLLEEEGFAAVGAANGLEALNFLAESKRKPSLILLDLMMPVLDGWTFCKVRQGISMLMDIPVVAISAAPMNGSHEPLRVDATLPKPFDPDSLAWLATRMAGRKPFFSPRGNPRGH
ncbi:MAG TPA: response regulator [Polyangia bacterium]|nr:response regulator [Polyangia bacterium]